MMLKLILKRSPLAVLLLSLFIAAGCGTESADNANANTGNTESASEAAEKLDEKQLDNLLAPVALYPDPLLAQVLPASTFPEDISKAAAYVKSNGDKGIDDQDWPVSVKAVSYYPDALYYMDENPDWTTRLGQAYALQPADVMDSVQRLRLQAKDAGNLRSGDEYEVVMKGDDIALYPAKPQYLYVPQYDPQEVYYDRRDSGGNGLVSSLIKFGAGVAVGVWLNNAFDWGGDRVYYHGWRDDDPWARRTRDYYRWDDDYYRDSYYVDDRWRDVYINRDVVYRPVRYDRITVYDRIFPGISYRTKGNREKEVPGLGDEMRRQDPGRPIEKGPPPGQIKKDKYDDRGGPPSKNDKLDKGRPDDGGKTKGADKPKGKPDDKGAGKPAKSGGPDKGKGKSDAGGQGKGKKP